MAKKQDVFIWLFLITLIYRDREDKMQKYRLSLLLIGMPKVKIVWANIIPETGKAYIFKGFSDKAYFIAQVDNLDNKGSYRIIEGSRAAFENARTAALENPTIIEVEPVADYLQ